MSEITYIDRDYVNRIEDKILAQIKDIDTKFSKEIYSVENRVSGLSFTVMGIDNSCQNKFERLIENNNKLNEMFEETTQKTNELYQLFKDGKIRMGAYWQLLKWAFPVLVFLQILQLFILSHVPDHIEQQLLHIIK